MTLDHAIILMTAIAVITTIFFILYTSHRIRMYHKANIQRIKEREAQKAGYK